ncbi:MAG TPA: DinB family protein [Candidatus Acidoferrales bacterium]|nr:DinB family protein [Candidatus Acidoferrales bacterium]
MIKQLVVGACLCALGVLAGVLPARAQDSAQKKPPTPSQAILDNWNDVGKRIVAMAEDWPEDKYGYRPNPGVRSFGDVIRHIAGANYEIVNSASMKKLGVEGDNPSADMFKTKTQLVEYVKKSVADGAATIHELGDDGVMKRLDDWVGYIEHMGEHYGQLVVYYRNNGVVPPASRPKK